jgi:hypothetical protein
VRQAAVPRALHPLAEPPAPGRTGPPSGAPTAARPGAGGGAATAPRPAPPDRGPAAEAPDRPEPLLRRLVRRLSERPEPAPPPAPERPRPRRRAAGPAAGAREQRDDSPAPPGARPPAAVADLDRLAASIERVTDALAGQPLEFYERDLPEVAAAEAARRVEADVVVLLLDDGEGALAIFGSVGLQEPDEQLRVPYAEAPLHEAFRTGIVVVDDTRAAPAALARLPAGGAATLAIVPLAHAERPFGVVLAGRRADHPDGSAARFTDEELDALQRFAEAVAPSLRAALLLRHLKEQLEGHAPRDPGIDPFDPVAAPDQPR